MSDCVSTVDEICTRNIWKAGVLECSVQEALHRIVDYDVLLKLFCGLGRLVLPATRRCSVCVLPCCSGQMRLHEACYDRGALFGTNVL